MKKWTKILLIIVIVILLLFVGMSYFIGRQVFMGSTQLVTCEDTSKVKDSFWERYNMDYDVFCSTYTIEKVEITSTFDEHMIPADYIYALGEEGDKNNPKEIYNIINDMAEVLNASQTQKLQEVLVNRLSENRAPDYLQTSNEEFLDMFLTAKHLEGCSDKTIRYYRCNIQRMLEIVDVPAIKISTEMLRKYLVEYQSINNCGKVTIDNIRRSLSTFFSWLEEEDYIIKSPMKRIHKVKTAVVVKETLPDEKVEILRDNCENLRDRAMIDFLLSTGIRVGELVRLNIEDIDFSERECVVYGKGDKERKAYFDAKTKLHLMNYIESRIDNNKALFVSLNRPHDRLTESGVELRLREMGKKLGVEKVHPHKFRRTMATRAIEKGMPIEQVQKILGHEQIDTTLRYAMVNQNNVKLSHRKYIS